MFEISAESKIAERRRRVTNEQIQGALDFVIARRGGIGAGPLFNAADIEHFDGSLRDRLRTYVNSAPRMIDILCAERDDADFYRVPEPYITLPSDHLWPAASSRKALTGSSGLAFFGPVGTGKSYAASAVLNALQQLGHPATFISAPDLAADLRASFRKGSEDADEIIDRLIVEPLLCIDDIDKINASPFVAESVFAIIDGRYRARLPLFVTTNCAPGALGTAFSRLPEFGAAIADRIRAMCSWLELRGNSRRVPPRSMPLEAPSFSTANVEQVQ